MGRTEYGQSTITWWYAHDPPNDERPVLVVVEEIIGEPYIDIGRYYADVAAWGVGEHTTRRVRCWAEMPGVPDE